jgi:hypothetical protein
VCALFDSSQCFAIRHKRNVYTYTLFLASELATSKRVASDMMAVKEEEKKKKKKKK